MATYKLKYSGEKIDELLTKTDNLGTGSGTTSGTVKLSDAVDSDSGVADGVASTPKAVKQVNDALAQTNTQLGQVSDSLSQTNTELTEIKADITNLQAETKQLRNDVDILQKKVVYGWRIKHKDSNPATCVSYLADNRGYESAKMNYSSGVFDYGSWEDAFFMPKPCMLGYDGVVKEYLDPNDYSKKIDGTPSSVADLSFAGNAMVEWGKIWYKYTGGDDYTDFYVSNVQADSDFECWSNHAAGGVVKEHFYTPIYTGYYDGTCQRSISGTTSTVYQNATQEFSHCQANGVGWDMECFADRMLINSLLILIGKNLDTQTAFGNGVIIASTAIANGTMDDKGLFFGANNNTTGVKVFGMENYWGNIWRRTAGWICDNGTHKIKMCNGTEDGSTVTGYNENGEGYISISGATPTGTQGSYISGVRRTKFGMIPYQVSGSSTTYFCDGMWFNNSIVSFARVGGAWSNSVLCGAFCAYLGAAAGHAYTSIGASASYK